MGTRSPSPPSPSSSPPEQTREAARILRELGTPCLIHQPSYNMFNRWIEEGLLDVLDEQGIGCIVYVPLAQGLLTDRYLAGIPEDSRAAKPHGALQPERITDQRLSQVRALNEIAQARGQTMAQMALAWNLRLATVTSVLIGASRVSQIEENVAALQTLSFSDEELAAIEAILAQE